MDLIQHNGQPRYGHLAVTPKTINIDRYEYKSLDGTILQGWRKRLHYKKYKFCTIQHQHYSIGLAIANTAWLGHSFLYIYDHQQHEIMTWEAQHLLSRKTVLDEQPLFNQSYFEKYPYQLTIEHANGVRYIQFLKLGEIQLSARIFCAGTQALSLCHPTHLNGWRYTQKLMTLNCEGFFQDKQGKIIPFDQHSLVSLNDTCGFQSQVQEMHHLSCNFYDQQQQRIGLHLVSQHDQHVYSENSLWLNGNLFALDQVIFQQDAADVWHVYSVDQRLHLTIQISRSRRGRLNLPLLENKFKSWQATVNGYVKHQGQEIIFSDQYAVFAQHLEN